MNISKKDGIYILSERIDFQNLMSNSMTILKPIGIRIFGSKILAQEFKSMLAKCFI